MSDRPTNHPFTIPLVLFALCTLSYGILVPWLGWYWDDWPSIWFLRVLGASGFTDVFTIDRPPLGYLFWVTTSILGDSLIGWQIFGFISRWLSCLAFWWFLKQLWEDKPELVAWAAILFTIYPGFFQQYIPITYSHMYIILALLFFSLGTMIKGIKTKEKPYLYFLASLLSAGYSIFTLEYFFGLELLRPVFAWVGLKRSLPDSKSRLKKVVKVCLPYWAILAGFLYWRLAIHPTPRGKVQVLSDPSANLFTEIFALIPTIFQDIYQASLLAWANTFDFDKLKSFGLLPTLAYIALIIIVAASMIIFLRKYHQKVTANQAAKPSVHWEFIIIGTLSLLTAGIPFWMTHLPIELYFPWDRFTLAFMAGVSLLFSGILELIPIRPMFKIGIIGILVGAAVGTHFYTANDYRREWNTEKDFFWQIAWRAPQIKPGTVLLTSELPFKYSSDNSFTAPINMMYAPQNTSTTMPYLFVSIESRLDTFLTSLEKGIEIKQLYRSFIFNGTTSQALVFYYSPPGCVKFLDPALDARLPQKPKYLAEAMRLSNLDLIDADPASPVEMPASIFGQEPKPNWCYYYEKADLARRTSQWQLAADLGEQAFALNTGLYEVNAPEYLPYIEANAHLGNWEKAIQLSRAAYQLNFRMQRVLCDTWQHIADTTSPSLQQSNAVQLMTTEYRCQE